jgi:sporulation protein YlmC with PRC-barrel domain
MRTYLSIATVCVTVLGLSGAAMAGDNAANALDKAATDTANQTFTSTADLAPLAERLVGKEITNSAGDNIGEIQDLAIGPDKNAYAIVSVGEFLGLGGKDVPVQISELTMQGDDVVLMSQSTKEALKARPKYDPAMYQSYSESKDR